MTCFNVTAVNLPELGQPAFGSLTPLEERRLGQTVLSELRTSLALSNDEIVSSYLNELGYRIVATLNQKASYPYYFFAVQDNSINAFALPGGFIGVNTGLILTSTTESELAAVMAHEVGHVSQQHIARMYQRGHQVTIASVAGLIAAAIIATQNAEAGTGAMAATLAGSTQSMINFTRENEKEADFIGMEALAKAGFDPQGMPSFFQRMDQATRYYDNGAIPEFLRTHPLNQSRLVAAKERAAQYPYKQILDSQTYHLIKARLKIDSFNSPSQVKRYFEKQLSNKTYTNLESVQYGYALSLLKLGEIEAALDKLAQLTKQHPDQPLFQLAYAQAEDASNQTVAAKARLATALKNHPHNHALTLNYAKLLLKTDEAPSAVRLLNQHALTHAKPDTYLLLAKAYFASGQPQLAHLAQAEYHITMGDLTHAIRQLELADQLPALQVKEQAQIRARLTELKGWLKVAK